MEGERTDALSSAPGARPVVGLAWLMESKCPETMTTLVDVPGMVAITDGWL